MITIKIGIFGGAFDPPHKAHLMVANRAIAEFALDKLYFIPSGNHPYKNQGASSKSDRLNMIKLLTQGADKVSIDTSEMDSDSVSFTYNTIKEYAGKDNEIFFIMGADSLFDIENWHEAEKLMRLCSFLVYKRDELDVLEKINELKDKYGAKIFAISGESVDISSSKIRSMVHDGHEFEQFVDVGVSNYIKENNLYL